MGWQAALKPYVIKLNPSKTVTQKVKGEVFVYDWNNQWNFFIHLKPEFSQTICSL